MKRLWMTLRVAAALVVLTATVSAQDYRGRVQGSVSDSSSGALPGVTITLINDGTGVTSTRVTDAQGRFVFDFVDPGSYSVTGELSGFKKADQRNVRVPQRGDVTANLTMQVGGVEETVVVEAAPVAVQFNTSSSDITIERQLVDQVPINGRNPYALAALDPTVNVNLASENRPYHHAYANDYDAGGGTRRSNDVLLDGVALGASYKTAYTPAMDAVDEVTISKNSVDAENGHSLGGIISLNMKAGTNIRHGSVYLYSRDPSLNSIGDPTIRRTPGQDTRALRGSDLSMFGATLGGPIMKNRLFSFTSYERWDDKRPISIVRTVPTELERRGDFSQSVLNGRVRTVFNPFSSTLDPAGRVVRNAFTGNVIPSSMIDPVAARMLAAIPLPNLPGNVDNLQGSVIDATDYWNVSQRVDLNISDSWKVFVRYGQFKANLYQENPGTGGFYPLSGSNRYGMSLAGDSVWVLSEKTTVNVRASYYNMTDEFYNPSLLLGSDGLRDYWGRSWYSSLYNSGYVYYPALDVTSGTGTATTNRLGRQGREWFQHPDAWTVSARMNRYQGRHSLKWGGEVRAYYGEAARFEPINLVFNSAMTANSSDTPDVVGTGNQWASFLLGALDNQTSARLVPLQNPDLRGYAAYVQDDYYVSDRLSLNLGLRWEYEPGPTDPNNRLSQRIDLTQPIPEMQATPPPMVAQAQQLMASKGYTHIYNGAWIFATDDSPNAWHSTPWNFLPRFGATYKITDDSAIRFAYARYLMPTSNVRDTLGDFVEQYAGFAQTTNTLGLAAGVPRQTLNDPFPAGSNPVIEPYGQAYGRYTNLGGAANLDEFELRPQINDRFNLSYQKDVFAGVVLDLQYFFNWGTRVPFDKDLNMMDPAFRYEQKAVLNTQVANPFRNYLTAEKFPGALRNPATVTLGSLLKPYPQYSSIIQRNTNGRKTRTHTAEIRAQKPFTKGVSFFAAYAWNNEKRQEAFDDLAQYKINRTGEGWEWRTTDSPTHRVTAAVTWQLPIGRDQRFLSDMPRALDAVVGGWQYSATGRYYSGRPLFFGQSLLVDGNPKIDNPTNDRWFNTAAFRGLQDSFTPRNNPWVYDGLVGPSVFMSDMTLTKGFKFTSRYRLEARIEAYNVFNGIVWDQPDVNVSSANFGKVTRKRIDGTGREVQIGLRFVF
jgi:outer membrane receptor protein involved in Fe transport